METPGYFRTCYRLLTRLFIEYSLFRSIIRNKAKYSRMDQVKFVEESPFLGKDKNTWKSFIRNRLSHENKEKRRKKYDKSSNISTSHQNQNPCSLGFRKTKKMLVRLLITKSTIYNDSSLAVNFKDTKLKYIFYP